MRIFEPVVVDSARPVGDHDRWRMCGGIEDGRDVSENRIGFCVAKVRVKLSFRRGRERAGAGMTEGYADLLQDCLRCLGECWCSNCKGREVFFSGL